MGKKLQVDPVDLHISSEHLAVHHADFKAAHASADADIESAAPGWVGSSAAALQAKLAEWQAATAQLSSDVEAHGVAFRAAAEDYTETDDDNAGSLDSHI